MKKNPDLNSRYQLFFVTTIQSHFLCVASIPTHKLHGRAYDVEPTKQKSYGPKPQKNDVAAVKSSRKQRCGCYLLKRSVRYRSSNKGKTSRAQKVWPRANVMR